MLYKTHNALLSIDKDKLYLEALYRWSLPPSKALTKRTRKSTQVCKPQLAYGLARGGQTDSQVGSQVHANRKKPRTYKWVAIHLCWVANGEKLASTCVQIWARSKSTQVKASGWPNETQVACVDLRVRLARFVFTSFLSQACVRCNLQYWRIRGRKNHNNSALDFSCSRLFLALPYWFSFSCWGGNSSSLVIFCAENVFLIS